VEPNDDESANGESQRERCALPSKARTTRVLLEKDGPRACSLAYLCRRNATDSDVGGMSGSLGLGDLSDQVSLCCAHKSAAMSVTIPISNWLRQAQFEMAVLMRWLEHALPFNILLLVLFLYKHYQVCSIGFGMSSHLSHYCSSSVFTSMIKVVIKVCSM
jgi:hypothetical protein